VLEEIKNRLITNPSQDKELRRMHSEIIKSNHHNLIESQEGDLDMSADELIELHGAHMTPSQKLLFHANSDFIELVDRLVSRSANNFYTNSYDKYQSFSNGISY
jgi:hypothetical protein